MTLAELIQKAYLLATGKPTAPSTGSRKYNQLLELSKIFTETWQNEPGTDWTSLFDYRDSGTVTATDTFELDDEIRKVSQQDGDYVRIVEGDQETEYEVVSADRLWEYRYSNAVAQVGRNLMFSREFISSDAQIGGTIVVPSYGYADVATAETDEIAVDDPMWLVYMVAAEFVRNDITRQNQYPNLIAMANDAMEKMKENSGRGVEEVVKTWEPTAGMEWY